MKICPNCSKECNEEDAFCGVCGFSFKPVSSDTKNAEDTNEVNSQNYNPVPAQTSNIPPVSNNGIPQNQVSGNQYQQNGYYQNTGGSDNYPHNQNFNRFEPQYLQKKIDPLAIASLVLGLVALVTMCCYFLGVIPGVVGLVMGIISMKRTKSDDQYRGHGLAIGGFVTSLVAVGFCVSCIILIAFGLMVSMPFFNNGMNDLNSELHRNSYYSKIGSNLFFNKFK